MTCWERPWATGRFPELRSFRVDSLLTRDSPFLLRDWPPDPIAWEITPDPKQWTNGLIPTPSWLPLSAFLAIAAPALIRDPERNPGTGALTKASPSGNVSRRSS